MCVCVFVLLYNSHGGEYGHMRIMCLTLCCVLTE